jgi:hypothetical protein
MPGETRGLEDRPLILVLLDTLESEPPCSGGCKALELEGCEGGPALDGANEAVEAAVVLVSDLNLLPVAFLFESPVFSLAAPVPLILPSVVALGVENVACTPSFVLRLVVGLASAVL